MPALNEAPFGVLGLAKTGELAFANPAARRLLGLDIATGALPEADWADRLQADSDAARHDGAAAGRYRIVPLPPDRFVRWWAMAGGELVFLFDATEQQRADQAARRLLNDLSHELRTPLATILTHAEVQSLPNLPDATRAESLRLLKEETQRAVRLRHVLKTPTLHNNRIWALVDKRGFLREMSPAFIAYLRENWPGWNGNKLPERLLSSIQSGQPVRVASVRFEVTPCGQFHYILGKPDGALEQLSAREREIATRYARGDTYSAIAASLSLSPATVRNHIAHCFRKLAVSNKLELARRLDGKP